MYIRLHLELNIMYVHGSLILYKSERYIEYSSVYDYIYPDDEMFSNLKLLSKPWMISDPYAIMLGRLRRHV